MSHLIAKIRRSLARDANLPLGLRAAKARRYVSDSLFAPLRLRKCSLVGARARVAGRLVVQNDGRIEIGSDVVMFSAYSPVELQSGPAGILRLGVGVHVNYGTSLRAVASVRIGDSVSIGPYCIVDDAAVRAEDGGLIEGGDAIEIGDRVWLAGRVTVLPGARIGAGSVITAGSIVSGEIPRDVVAGGIPARVIRSLKPTKAPGANGSRSGDVGDESPAEDSSSHAAHRAELGTPAMAAASIEPEIRLQGRVLADFTIGDFAIRMADATDGVSLDVVEAPYNQTAQRLLAGNDSTATDFLVVWTRPEIASPAFARLLESKPVTEAELLSDVDAFSALLATGAQGYRYTFVPSWVLPAHHRGLGMLDLRPGGVGWALAVMNQRLMQHHAATPAIYVLNAQRWMNATVVPGRSPAKAWYLGKVPFPSELFAEAANDIKAAVRGLLGQRRKLLVLDLDDTLWGGIVGDAGWENLQLGGHDPIGEVFVDFQRALKALTRRGVVLGIVSKNTEEVALSAIQSHPEMVLRLEDFAGWRINWNDKAQNIADLAAELNLGLQSVAFVDDNPAERARVRDALPEVYVPEWPGEKLQYVERLLSLRCFDAPAVSTEDIERTRYYAAERERNGARERVASLDEWLKGLDMHLHAEPLSATNLARVHQLLNKTNQMNLTTRRLTESELERWSRAPGRLVLAVSVADRFGPAGLTGILSLERRGDRADIVDFVLSCRVMGRRVEEALLHLAVEWARGQGVAAVHASYQPTKKNKPCHDFFRGSRFARDDAEAEFWWSTTERFPLPDAISLEMPR